MPIDSKMGFDMQADHRHLLLKCLILGAVIEAPLLIWFLNASRGNNQTTELTLLWLLHAPGSVPIMMLLIPLRGRCSETVFHAIRWGGTFIMQSCIVGCVLFGILIATRKRGIRRPVGCLGRHRVLLLKSLLAAAAIETPLFVWFLSIKNPHDEKFIILATYHLAGCLIGQLTALALARVISERAADVIVWAVIFVVQLCLVAFVAFAIMRGREKLRS